MRLTMIPCGADGPVGLRARLGAQRLAVPISAGEGRDRDHARRRAAECRFPRHCHANESTPAVIGDGGVTEQVMLQPPQIGTDGIVREPAVYVTETQQRIVEERRELWFEIPCQLQLGDPDFIASMQRALATRGLYSGPVTGG